MKLRCKVAPYAVCANWNATLQLARCSSQGLSSTAMSHVHTYMWLLANRKLGWGFYSSFSLLDLNTGVERLKGNLAVPKFGLAHLIGHRSDSSVSERKGIV